MADENRRRILDLEKEADDIKGQVIAQWHRIRRVMDEIERIRGDVDEDRLSQSSVDRYRDEMPSETQLSLHPTGLRLRLLNTKPSGFLVALLVILVLGIIALVWLLRPR